MNAGNVVDNRALDTGNANVSWSSDCVNQDAGFSEHTDCQYDLAVLLYGI